MMKGRICCLLFLTVLVGCLTSCGPARPQQSSRAAEIIPLAQEFIELVVKEDFAAAEQRLDATMKDAMPAAKLEEGWKSLLAEVGPFKRQGDARAENSGKHDSVFVTCEFEKATLNVKIVFNDEKQISGLWFVSGKSSAEKSSAYQPPD